MANQLAQAQNLSPITLDPANPNANDLTAAFAGWASKFFSPEGVANANTPTGVRRVNVQFRFDFQGATSIEILPELAAVNTVGTPAPGGKVDSAGDAFLDTVNLLPANMLSDPGSIDLGFDVEAASRIRFSARFTGAGAPTLEAWVTAG